MHTGDLVVLMHKIASAQEIWKILYKFFSSFQIPFGFFNVCQGKKKKQKTPDIK